MPTFTHIIKGTRFAETTRGTNANDKIDGRGGADVLRGLGGADYLFGGIGADTLLGGGGADRLAGGAGDDTLKGGAGRDRLDGGAGNDQLWAGGGNDRAAYKMAENAGARDVYRGGRGIDTLVLEFTLAEWSRAEVQADVAAYLGFLGEHTDPDTGKADAKAFRFTAFDLEARQFEDLRIVVDGVDLDPVEALAGRAPQDKLASEADPTPLRAAVFDDEPVLEPATHARPISAPEESGLAPAPSLLRGPVAGGSTAEAPGSLTVMGTVPAAEAPEDANPAPIDNATIQRTFLAASGATEVQLTGADERFITSDPGGVAVSAGDGSDAIVGAGGSDTLDGDGGDDVLVGGAGDDVLIGAGGNDVVTGGAGADIFSFDADDAPGSGGFTAEFITDFETGVDTVELSGFTGLGYGDISWTPTVDGIAAFLPGARAIVFEGHATALPASDFAFVAGGRDVVVTGIPSQQLTDADDRYVSSGPHADAVDGRGGNDAIVTGEAADTLAGGAGDDVLMAGSSDDRLHGGPGRDTHTGGAGADTFRFVGNDDPAGPTIVADYITDYEPGIDTIEIHGFAGIAGFDDLSFLALPGGLAADLGGNRFLVFEGYADPSELTPTDFLFDGDPPVLTVALADDTGTSSGDGLTHDPGVAGQTSDDVGLMALELRLGAGSYVDVTSAIGGDGSFALDHAALETALGVPLLDGALSFTMRASDLDGHTTEETVELVLDTTPPDVASAPTGAHAVAPDLLLVSFSEAMAAVAFLADGYTLTEDGGPEVDIVSVDPVAADSLRLILAAPLADGDYTLTVPTAPDLAGNSLAGPNVFGFYVDTTAEAPVLSVTPASGDEDTGVALDITSALTDTDGSETLAIEIAGVPAGAVLSAGSDQGGGIWALTPVDLAGLTLTPPLDSDDDITLTVTARSMETVSGDTAETSATLDVTVNAVADAPTLTVSPAQGDEDSAIALDITSALTDTDGSEILRVEIAGVPTGATLSAGSDQGGGTWLLTPAELAGLTLTPPADSDADITLTVTARSTEGANGDTAETSATLDVTVNAVADAPTLAVSPAQGDEDSAIALDITSALTDTDGSESLRVEIAGVPTGATLSAGSDQGGGTWLLTPAELAGLTLTPPVDSDADITLTVTSRSTEGANGDSAETSATLDVTVDAVADAPTLAVSPAQGDEDSAIALDITSALTDTDGSESLRVEIAGVPTGATLSAGSDQGGGIWLLTPAELAGLTLTPPADSDADITLTVTARSTEALNSDTAETSATLDVTVNAVADAPTLTVSPAQGDEDTLIPLDITSALVDTDGSESLEIEIAGVPTGATLSAGSEQGGGTWLLTPTELAGLTLTPPPDSDEEFTLTVTARSTESANSDTAETSATLDVTVDAVADAPTLALAPAGDAVIDLTPVPTAWDVQVHPDAWIYKAVAALDDGGFLVVYTRNGTAQSQRYDAAGDPVGVETRVDTVATKGRASDIAVLPDGGWVVCWTAGGDVYFRRFAPDGTALDDPILANPTNPGSGKAAMTALQDGGWVITWDDGDGSWEGVYSQRFDLNGDPVGGTILVNTTTNAMQTYSDVIGLSDGGWLVTWTSDGQDPSPTGYPGLTGVYAQRFAADGSAFGDEFRVNTTVLNEQELSDAALLADGGWVIAWSSFDGDGDGVFLQRYDAGGNPVGGETQVNTDTTGPQNNCEVTALDDGGWLGTWMGQDSDGRGIYAQRFDIDGNLVGNEVRINDRVAGDQYHDSSLSGADNVVQLADGRTVTLYEHYLHGVYYVLSDIPPIDPDGIEDQPLEVHLSAALVDTDGSESLSIVLSGYPAGATFSLGYEDAGTWVIPDAHTLDLSTLTMTPPADWNGTFTLEATATATEAENGDTAQTTTSADYTIAPVNDAPVAGDDVFTLDEDTTTNLDILGNDIDVEGDPLGRSTINGSAVEIGDTVATDHGTLTVQADWSVDYTPDTNYSGADSFTYTVSDGRLASGEATVTIDVTPVADAPDLVLGAKSLSDLAPVPAGPEVQVNTTTADAQTYPSVTALDDGGFVVTWSSENQDGSGYGIYSQRYDAAENPVGGETLVNTTTAGDQTFSEATALADGGWLVTWSSNGQDGSSWGVYGQRFDAGGLPVGSEFRVNTYTSDTQYDSEVAPLADGGWVVVWSSVGQDGYYSSTGIYSQRYDAAGNPVGAETWVSTNGGNFGLGDVAALADGGWLVTWYSGDSNILAQRYDSGGNPVAGVFQVNTYTTEAQKFSDTAGLADGGWVVTWSSDKQDGDEWGVYSQRYDAAGNPVGDEIRVNSEGWRSQNYSEATALDDGGWLISWRSSAGDASDRAIYTQRYNALGDPVGVNTKISSIDYASWGKTGSIDYNTPSGAGHNVAVLADGRMIAVHNGAFAQGEIYYVLSDLPDSADGLEDGPMQVNLTAALVDTDGSESLAIVLSGFPAGATFSLGHADGGSWVIENAESLDLSSLTMTPPPDWNGFFTLTATATATETANGHTAETVASADYRVAPVNDAPVAGDDSGATDEDTVLTVAASGVLVNDTDVDTTDVLRVSAHDATSAEGATVTVNPDGSFGYDPTNAAALQELADGASVVDTFDYTLSDGRGGTDTGTVSITVAGLNDAPTLVAGTADAVEDGPVVDTDLAALGDDLDSDDDGTMLGYAITAGPAEGAASIAGTTLTFNPGANFQDLGLGETRDVTVTVEATDSHGATGSNDVIITVTGTNDLPVAGADFYGTNEESVQTRTAATGLLFNDTDFDASDVITVVSYQPVSDLGATVVVSPDGGYSYDPTGAAALQALGHGQGTVDHFVYEIDDGHGGRDHATVSISVSGVNDAPVAVDDSGTTDEDTVLTVAATGVLANDTDVDTGAALTVTGYQAASVHGASVSVNADGSFDYDPTEAAALQSLADGAELVDEFEYTVGDGAGGFDTATVFIIVTGLDEPMLL